MRKTRRLMLLALAALAGTAPGEVRYLSGTDKDHTVNWAFFCTSGRKSGYWTTIPVPSFWELQGFGEYSYDHDGAFPAVGYYRHSFFVPAAWSNQTVKLTFEAVMTDAEVWINGASAGPRHQGSFYPFSFDITKLLRLGETNQLAVTVKRHSDDATVNGCERAADFWIFGGIFRPVFLEALPQEHLERVAIDAQADGQFTMDVYTANAKPGEAIRAELRRVSQGTPAAAIVASLAGTVGTNGFARLATKLANPARWSAETPNLYTAFVTLGSGHSLVQRFGFRTLEMRPGQGFFVNGRRVLLKGVCRHSFWPESGRCLSRAVHLQDIALIQEMNMNAVRMSHYPPDREFLDLCDEAGLYVLDEFCSWGRHSIRTALGHQLIGEMVRRDVNHPCIIAWDNGNEGGWNTALDGDYAVWDPQHRTVLHPYTHFGPTETKHYPNYAQLSELLGKKDAVVFPTEFLHGLYDGGHGAGLEDYWNLMRASRTSAGGFLWALVDEGIINTYLLGDRIDVMGDRAPDGILGPHREKEGSFYTIKEIWSPIVLAAPRGRWTNDSVTVENRFDFTNLKDCSFRWQLRRDAKRILAKGTLTAPDVAPGGRGTLRVNLPAAERAAAEWIALTAKNPAGREIFTWTWPLKSAAESCWRRLLSETNKTSAASASVSETADTVTLKGGRVEVTLSKASGVILNVIAGGVPQSLAGGPRLTPEAPRVAMLGHAMDGNSAYVEVAYEITSNSLVSATWRMSPAGLLKLDYSYTMSGKVPFLGISFAYPESKMKRVEWLGDGPTRVWKNRRRGAVFGEWGIDYNQTLTGQSGWVYPEFRGYFSGMRWMKLLTSEGTLTVTSASEGKFFRLLGWYHGAEPYPLNTAYLTPPSQTVDSTRKPNFNLARVNPPFPWGSLSFLDGIPAIGTKFHDPEELGPMSQPNRASGIYRGTLYFSWSGSETAIQTNARR